jgi:hypothetical protein
VSAKFAPGEIPPIDMFKEWIDESYRAQAPKKLVASLATRGDTASKPKAKVKVKVKAAKRSAAKIAKKTTQPKKKTQKK